MQTVFRSPRSNPGNADVSLRLIADGNKSLLRIRTDRGLAGPHHGLAAAASRSFLEFTTKAEYAFDYGMPQWLAQAESPLIAATSRATVFVVGRSSTTSESVVPRLPCFLCPGHPPRFQKTLSRPYIQRTALQAMVQGHLSGKRNYTLAISKMLSVGTHPPSFHRLADDESPRAPWSCDGRRLESGANVPKLSRSDMCRTLTPST